MIMPEATGNETPGTVEDSCARQQRVAQMVQEAMKKPGVQAMMKVYTQWRQLDERLRANQRASRPAPRVLLSNRTGSTLP